MACSSVREFLVDRERALRRPSMKNPTTLLVGEDAGLIRFLSEAVNSTGHSTPEVVRRVEDVRAKAANDDLAIVIVHLREGDDIREVARMREYLTQCGSPGALLIICDGYRVSQARDCALVRGDRLSTPATRLQPGRLPDRDAGTADPAAEGLERYHKARTGRSGASDHWDPATHFRTLRIPWASMSPTWSAAWLPCHRLSYWGEKPGRVRADWRG